MTRILATALLLSLASPVFAAGKPVPPAVLALRERQQAERAALSAKQKAERQALSAKRKELRKAIMAEVEQRMLKAE